MLRHRIPITCRYADKLEAAHDTEHLAKFEELLEAAVDLDRIPDEYLICASYDADLQVCFQEPYSIAASHRKGSHSPIGCGAPFGKTCC